MLRVFQILQKNLSELFTKKIALIFRSLLANFKNLQNKGFWPHIYFVKWTRKSTFLLIFGAYLTRKIARKSQICELKWISNDIFHLIWKYMPLNMELVVEIGFCAHFWLRWRSALQKYSRYTAHFWVCTKYFQRIFSKFYWMLLRIRQIVRKKQGLNCEKFQIHHKYRKILVITLSERCFCKKKYFWSIFSVSHWQTKFLFNFQENNRCYLLTKKTA